MVLEVPNRNQPPATTNSLMKKPPDLSCPSLDQFVTDPEALTDSQFTRLCDQFQSGLDSLVAELQKSKGFDALPEFFGVGHVVLRLFRGCFQGNRKLKNRMFQVTSEREVEKQRAEAEVDRLTRRVRECEEKMRAMETMVSIPKEGLVRRKETEVEGSEDEWKLDYHYIAHRDRLEDAQDRISLLQQDIRLAQEREESLVQRELEVQKEMARLTARLASTADQLEVSERRRLGIEKLLEQRAEAMQEDVEAKEAMKAELEKAKEAMKAANERAEQLQVEVRQSHHKAYELQQINNSNTKRSIAQQFLVTFLKSEQMRLEEVLKNVREAKKSLEHELNKCQSSLNDHSQRVDTLVPKVKELTVENDRLRDNEKRMQKDFDALLKKRDTYDDVTDNFRKQVQRINADLHTNKMLLRDRTVQFRAQQRSNIYFRRELDTRKMEVKEMRFRMQQLKGEQKTMRLAEDKLRELVQELKLEVRELHWHHRERDAEAAKMKEELQREREVTRFHQEAEFALKSQLGTAQRKMADMARMQQAVDSSNELSCEKLNLLGIEVDNLRTKINQLQLKNKTATSSLHEKERIIQTLKEDFSVKEGELTKVLRTLETRNRELEMAHERAGRLTNDLRTAQLKAANLTSQLEQKVCRIGSLEQELNRLQTELKKRQEEVETLRTELKLIKHPKVEKKTDTMAMHQNEIHGLKRMWEEERTKNRALEKEILKSKAGNRWGGPNVEYYTEPLLLKITHLQKELSRKSDALRRLNGRLQSKGDEVDALRAEMKRRSQAALDEKMWALQKDLQSSRSRVKSLLGERSVNESLCSRYEKEIEQLRTQLKRYSER